MTTTQISIGQVKRDISELVNRVAFGNERIVLTSRGKPKAAIVSMEDYERLAEGKRELRRQKRYEWLEGVISLSEDIAQRRRDEGLTKEIDLDAILKASREDLDNRHEL